MVLARDNTSGRSAEEEAYQFLLSEIRCGRLAGGAHVPAEWVSKTLHISRIPVREALRRLVSEGFVRIRSNRGAFVADLSGEDIYELYEMRAALEGLAIRYSTLAFDEKGRMEGLTALDRLDRSRADLEWFVEAHNAFHDLINLYCPRRRLVSEIVRLRTAAEPYLRMTLQHSPTAYESTVEEHRMLLDVLNTRDLDRCEALIRDHILNTDVTDLLPEKSEYSL